MIDWNVSSTDKIEYIKNKVSSGKFPQLLQKYNDGIDLLSIREDPLYSLATLGAETEENVKTYPFTIPFSNFDVATMSEFQRILDGLNIKYGKRDFYVAFKNKTEMNDAIVRVWFTGWENTWRIAHYMIENDLLCPEHIRKRIVS